MSEIKLQVPLKSTLRRPVQLMLIIALTAFAAFAFVSRAAEGLVVGGEINRLAGMYHSVGTLIPSVEELNQRDLRIPGEAVELIEAHPDVAYTDSRRVISGVMKDIYTPDVDGFSPYPNMLYAYGTLENKTEGYALSAEADVYFFYVRMDAAEACLPEYAIEPGTLLTFYLQDFDGSLRQVFEQAEVGERYCLKGQYGVVRGLYFSQQPPTELLSSASLYLLLRPQPETGLYFLPAAPGANVKTAAMARELEALEQNIRTVFLRTTKDLAALAEAGDALTLVEGRFLNQEDDEQGNRVCVIRREFAQLRGLKLGDTIAVTLRNLEAAAVYHPPDSLLPGGGSNAVSTPYGTITGYGVDNMHNLEMATGYITDSPADQGWRERETREEVLRIVGIYDTTDPADRMLTLSWNDVYVPDSCVPAAWVQDPVYTGFSLVLSSPGRERAVIQDLRSRLDGMGFWLEFYDSGWDSFAASVFPIRASVLWGVSAFSVITLAVFCLLVWLFFRQRRQEFAVMRALGSGPRVSARRTALPLLLMGGIGIALGGVPAWFTAMGQAAETLSGIDGAEYRALSPVWLVLMLAGLFLLLGLLTALTARSLSRRPVLELLQGKKPARFRPEAAPAAAPQSAPPPAPPEAPLRHRMPTAPTGRKNGSLAHTLAFAGKRALRTPVKSALSLLLAAGFLQVLSWMPASMEGNIKTVNGLYDSTEITAEIIVDPAGTPTNVAADGEVVQITTANIRSSTVNRVLETGYIADYYAESYQTMIATVLSPDPTVSMRTGMLAQLTALGVNHLGEFGARQGKALRATYHEGYGEEIFDKTEDTGERVALISQSLMEQLGARTGEYLALCSANQNYMFFKLVGWYEGDFADMVIPLPDMQAHVRGSMHYKQISFWLDPSKNRELEPFRQAVEEIFSKPVWPRLQFVLRDYALTDVVEPLERNIELMQVLYPIAMAVAALISAAVSLLLVLQSVEDAAKMRVLGTAKAQVCGALVFEQGLLCLLGLVPGGLAAIALFGGANWAASGIYLGCCLAAALAGALVVLGKKPLELLQVRE